MSGYYATAQDAIRAMEQARLDAGVPRDQAIQDATALRAEVLRLTELLSRPAGFPSDWRDQLRATGGKRTADQVAVDRVIATIVAWQAAART